MFVDSSLARGLAKKHLTEWGAQGILLRNKFERIIGNARFRLGGGASPSKCVNKALSDLRILFAQSPGAGSIVETHGRRSEFTLICPAPTDEGLAFSVLAGYLNGRTGGLDLKVTRPLVISIHALERLHQRIGVIEPTEVLNEIYGVVSKCAAVIRAAKQVGAQSCPLLSQRGIFVTAPTSDTLTSALITWMPFDQLSRKWGTVADDLREISERKPALLDDCEFLVEFLKSYRWMLKPHQPGIDFEAIAWSQAPSKFISPSALSARLISEDRLTAIEEDLARPDDHEHQSPAEVDIDDLLPEPGSLATIPPFKVNDRFVGLVVRYTQSGYVIVSLLNGWFGSIPPIGLDRANSVMDGLGNLTIGDKVSVEVRSLYQSDLRNSWLVALDLAGKVDAEWSLIEARYPPGEVFECVVARVLEHRCYLHVTDGVVAELPRKEMSWSEDPEYEGNILTPGQVVMVMVVGSSKTRRHLVVSKRRASVSPWDDLNVSGLADCNLTGIVFKVSGAKVHVRLPLGLDGVIRPENSHAHESLSVGQAIDVEVLQIDHDKQKISLTLSQHAPGPRKYFPVVEAMAEQWERIQVAYPIGTFVRGQITRLFPKGAGIVLADGPVGYLPDPELSWSREISAFKRTLEIGQFLKLIVIGMDASRRRLTFSHRQCTVRPWLDPEVCPTVGIEYKGVVANVVDFGAFIRLPGGLEGLLHKSVLPTGWRFEPDQVIDVIVTAIDHEKQRMALALTKN